MSRFIYSAAQLHFIAETFQEHSLDDTTALFNFVFAVDKTREQIRACLKNHGITCGRTPGQINKGRLLAFTHAQRDWIILNYPCMPLLELVDHFNAHFSETKGENQIRAFLKNHGIKSGRTGHFQAGAKPWNAGLTGWQAGGNSASTQFKAGHIPANWKPVGSERINVDGYIEIKVAEPGEWQLKHRHVWQQAHGPLASDQLIWFLDNDPTNCDLSNLMLASRAEHAVVNKLGLQHAHGEFKQTTRLIAGIAIAKNNANRRTRDHHDRS